MASFEFMGKCYPSESLALDAFTRTTFFSGLDGTPISISVPSSSVNVLGIITYKTLSNKAVVSTDTFKYALTPCGSVSESFVFDKMPVQDMIFAGVFVLVFVIGIFQGSKS